MTEDSRPLDFLENYYFPYLHTQAVCSLELGNDINNLYTKVTYLTFNFRLLHYHPPHLDVVPWTLNETFSAIQEVTQFCTTGFCSYLCKAAGWKLCLCNLPSAECQPTGQGRALFLAPGLSQSWSAVLQKKNNFHVLYISDKTGNIIQTTDLNTTSFIFLSFWADELVFIYLFPLQNFPWRKILA